MEELSGAVVPIPSAPAADLSSSRKTLSCPPLLKDNNIQVNPSADVPALLREAMSLVPGGLDRLDAILTESDPERLWLAPSRVKPITAKRIEMVSYLCDKLEVFAAIWKIHEGNPSNDELYTRQKKLSDQILPTLSDPKDKNKRTRNVRIVAMAGTVLYFHSAMLFEYLRDPTFHWNALHNVAQGSLTDPLVAGALLLRMQERASQGEAITGLLGAEEFKHVANAVKAANTGAAGAPLTVAAVAKDAAAIAEQAPSPPQNPKRSSSAANTNRNAKSLLPTDALVAMAARVQKTATNMRFSASVVAKLTYVDRQAILAALERAAAIAQQTLETAKKKLPLAEDKEKDEKSAVGGDEEEKGEREEQPSSSDEEKDEQSAVSSDEEDEREEQPSSSDEEGERGEQPSSSDESQSSSSSGEETRKERRKRRRRERKSQKKSRKSSKRGRNGSALPRPDDVGAEKTTRPCLPCIAHAERRPAGMDAHSSDCLTLRVPVPHPVPSSHSHDLEEPSLSYQRSHHYLNESVVLTACALTELPKSETVLRLGTQLNDVVAERESSRHSEREGEGERERERGRGERERGREGERERAMKSDCEAMWQERGW